MDPRVVMLMFVVFGIFAVITFAVWWFSADQRARRAMKATPLRRVSEVIEGEKARIVGRTEVAEPILSPLTARPCACWRVVIRERRRHGKNSQWVTLLDEHEGVDFTVRDGSDKALVKTQHIKAVLEKDGKFSSGVFNEPTPELKAFLHSRGLESQGWVFNKDLRYHEGVLEPGETVAVVGIGSWERDPDETARAGEGYREAKQPTRLVMKSPADGPLLLSDEPSMTR